MEVLLERYKPAEGELKDDDGLVIEYTDEQGNVLERHVGPSSREMFADHEQNKCSSWCPYCYHESEVYLENLAKEHGNV